jgi:hypothetical protein
MSPASVKKISCVFNTFIQTLPSAWSFPGTLQGKKTLPELGKDPKNSPKYTSDQPLVH